MQRREAARAPLPTVWKPDLVFSPRGVGVRRSHRPPVWSVSLPAGACRMPVFSRFGPFLTLPDVLS